MIKTILKISFALILLALPASVFAAEATAEPAESNFENAAAPIEISVSRNAIRVLNAQGQTLELYSVTGARIKAVKITAGDETVSFNVPRGCYIVKIGDFVRKVNLV